MAKLSQLIAKLEKIQDEHGDIQVIEYVARSYSPSSYDPLPIARIKVVTPKTEPRVILN